MKKIVNIISIAVITFLMFIVPSYAREMTLTELGEMIDEKGGVNAFIIGEYVFTSNHTLTTQDIMVAARSIDGIIEADGKVGPDAVSGVEAQPIYGKMSIQRIEKIYKGDEEEWRVAPEGNLVGTTQISSDKIQVKYIDYNYVKEESKFTVDFDKVKNDVYKTNLESTFNYKTDDIGDLALNGDKFTGTVKIKNDIKGFAVEAQTNYYLPFVILVPNATSATTIEIKGNGITNATYSNFDKTDTEKGIAVLWAVSSSASPKTITITVDLDGDGEVYGETTKVLDWSGVKFQSVSEAKISENIPEADNEYMKENWGYVLPTGDNRHYTFTREGESTTFKLSGIIEQQHIKEKVFGESAENGYYFLLNLNKTDDMSEIPDSAIIKMNSENEKTFKGSDLDENGLSVLVKLNDDCKKSSKCNFTVEIDWDGNGNDYSPIVYTIDYSEVTFEKASLFTIDGLDKSKKDYFDNNEWLNKEGYHTEVKLDQDRINTYKVSGVLPIFEDEEWEDDKPETFDKEHVLYYLGLLLKLTNTPENLGTEGAISESTIKVEFFHDETDESNSVVKAYDSNFDTSKELYILKALRATNDDGSRVEPKDKYFTITVDLDGEGKEYAEYTITIDYSELKFQDYSKGSSEFEILDYSKLDEGSAEKAELDNYKFNSDTVKEVKLKENTEQPDNHYIEGITGSIKQQTLDAKSGFKNLEGYYVPIKIKVPKDEDWFTEYNNTWTLVLHDEDGQDKTYTPTSTEHEQGWVLVLFRIDDKSGDKKIKYSIDFDSDGDAFLPYEYEISYETLNFQTENKITFEYFDEKTGKIVKQEEKTYQGEIIPTTLAPKFEDKNYAYHDFDYWYKDNSSTVPFELGQDGATTDENEDITLKAHWTINTDKFITDVVNNLSSASEFNEIFDVEKVDNTITFNVKDATALLSKMNETNIPGAIAYILQRGEVKDITLAFGEKKIVFNKEGATGGVQAINLDEEGTNLKSQIQAGAKQLFETVLSDAEETMTLNKMAEENREYTLTIGTLDGSVKLADKANSEYTFKFMTETAYVKSEAELNTALKNSAVKHINITQGFNVESTVNVERNVTIDGKDFELTATGSQPIFDVKSANVTINNIKLKDAKDTAIVVTTGKLTVNKATFTGADLKAGIEVKNGASLVASELTYDGETYEKPAVRAEASATVKLTDKTSEDASKVEKYKINRVDSGNDTITKDTEYNYYNYYNDTNNSKIYKTQLNDFEAGARLQYIKYNYYNEQLNVPTIERYSKGFTYEGETYTLFGFSKSSAYSVIVDGGEEPQAVIKKDEFRVTSDDLYWVSFKTKIVDTAAKVGNEQEFKEALQNGKKTIYITSNININLDADGLSNITRDVSIIGPSDSKNRPTITAKKITISDSANEVFFNRVNLSISAENGQDSLIEVNGKKFTLWQAGLENTGVEVDYAIKLNNTATVADIRFMGIDSKGFSSEKLKKGYIYVNGKLASGTEIYNNNFKALSDKENASDITINGFDASAATLTGDISPTIRIAYNSDGFNKYAIRLAKTASNQEANIKYEDSGNTKIGIDWEDNSDFSKISFYAYASKVSTEYIKADGITSSTAPTEGKGIKFVSQSVVVSD